jgi:hypothetical protein
MNSERLKKNCTNASALKQRSVCERFQHKSFYTIVKKQSKNFLFSKHLKQRRSKSRETKNDRKQEPTQKNERERVLKQTKQMPSLENCKKCNIP